MSSREDGRALAGLAVSLGFVAWCVHWAAEYAERYSAYRELPRALAAAIASCLEPPHAFLLSNAWRSLASASAFLLLAVVIYALGDVAIRLFSEELDPLEARLARIGAGAFVFHALMFVLGAAQLWYAELFFALALASAIHLMLRRPAAKRGQPEKKSAYYYFCLMVIALAALEGFAPETSADAGIYHVGVPNKWRLAHGFFFIRDHFPSNLPLPQSMFYGFLAGIGPSDSTRLFQPAMALVAAIALHRFVSLHTERRHFPLELGLLLAVPALAGYLGTSGNDQLTIAFFALGLLFGSRALEKNTSTQLAWSFAFFGLGMAAKYTALPHGLLAAAFFSVAWSLRGRSLRALALPALLFALPSLLWAAKLWSMTGNPVYPMFTDLFGAGAQHVPGIARAVSSNESRVETLRAFLLHLRDATLGSGLMHNPGPLWLMFGPPALIAALAIALARRRRETGLAIIFILAGWSAWALLYENARYSGPLFVATAAGISITADRVLASAGRARPLLVFTLGAFTAWSMLSAYGYRLELMRPWTYLCGRYDEVGYATEQNLPITLAPPHEIFRFLNRELDPDRAKVLLIGETRTAGLDIPHLSGNEYDRPIFERYVQGAATPAEVRRRLAADGITHIAVNAAIAAYLERHDYHVLTVGEDEARVWGEFFRGSTRLLAERDDADHKWVIVELAEPGAAGNKPRDYVSEALETAHTAKSPPAAQQ
jgi:hypothetical protein